MLAILYDYVTTRSNFKVFVFLLTEFLTYPNLTKLLKMAKAAPKRKAANGYKLAEPLPKGEILQDIAKKKWKLGPSIGQGGFGEIYSAQEANASGAKYPYVVKIEPHANGPLFVEMHFYMRNAKPTDVEDFKKEKGLKTFGMPLYLGSGSHDYKAEKYRFIVMEKFGTDLWKLFLENDRIFPTSTVFKLAIQILDILEYIHSRGYVHADIKGANILMGTTKETTNKQVYLVDFGLATKCTTEEEFKPNPKKAHDGTIEYLSRDAHKGVQTKRGDLEILAYNIIQWLGCTLPWEKNLKDPNFVHKCKEEYMESVPKLIKACFGNKTPPGALVDYLNYIKTLKFNSDPDYNKIRKLFISGVKSAGGSLNSPLEFSSKKTPKRKSGQQLEPSPKRKISRKKVVEESSEDEKENMEDDDVPKIKHKAKKTESDSDEDVIDATDDDEPTPKKPVKRNAINKKNDVEVILTPSKRRGRPKNKKIIEESSEDEKENMDDDDVPKIKHTIQKQESDSDEDIVNGSVEDEPTLKKTVTQNIKNKKNEDEEILPLKRRGRPKKNYKEDSEDEEIETQKTKIKPSKKKNNDTKEEIAEINPYEGYTDAMKEVLMKKMQNGKSKAHKKHKPTDGDDMHGYNDSMKELKLKKQERLTRKRPVRGKKTDLVSAPSTSKGSESDS